MASVPRKLLCFRFRSLAKLSQSAGDPHHLSADLVRLRLQQKLDQRGNIVRTGHPPQWNARDLRVEKLLAENLAHPLGIDRAGRDHVDANAIVAEAARKRAGETDDRGLGGVVDSVAHVIESAEGGQRRDVDDLAVPSCLERSNECLGDHERTPYI